MSTSLQKRIETLLARHDTVILATCGKAGPQIGYVSCRLQDAHLYLFVPRASDHLFNLETQSSLVLLAPSWKVHGRGLLLQEKRIVPPHTWQVVVEVCLVRLHILAADGGNYVETIDFGNLADDE